jgi:hypothetical protein
MSSPAHSLTTVIHRCIHSAKSDPEWPTKGASRQGFRFLCVVSPAFHDSRENMPVDHACGGACLVAFTKECGISGAGSCFGEF